MRHPFRWRFVPGVLLCAGMLFPVASAQAPKAQQPALLLEDAAKRELVDGDLKGAIDTLQRILKLEGVPRAITARALLHLGQCFEKLGTTEARQAYERIVREFADQPEEANLARGRLTALGGRDTAMRVRQVWAGAPDNLIGGVTRDGRYLTLQDGPSENLAVRDLTTGQKRKLTSKDPKSHEFASLSVPSPDGREVAFAWYNKDEITDIRVVGIDGSNLRVLRADPEFPEGEPFDWSPDGRHVLAAFYKKRGGSRLALVSLADGSVRVLKSIDAGGPNRVRLSPDGRYAAYDIQQPPGSAKYDVMVIALDGGKETAVVQHPANDRLFDWTPDGKKLLFGSDRSGTTGLWSIALAGGQPIGAPEIVRPDLGQDVRPLGFTRDGSYYYRSRTEMSDVFITEVDFASGRLLSPPVLATQRFAGMNNGPRWSPDGRQLLYLSRRGPGAGWGAKTMWFRDTATGEVRELQTKLETVARADWYPDGRSVLAIAQIASSWPGQFRIDAQTGAAEPVELYRVSGIGGAAWSHGGQTMYFQRWGTDKTSGIVARDLTTRQETTVYSLASPSVFLSSPMVSPDERFIAVVVNESATGSKVIKALSLTGGEARDVLRDALHVWPPSIAWAPDSRGILFVKQPDADDPKTELWLVPLQGGGPRRLELAASNMRDLSVHPDGRRLAYTSGNDRTEVWAMQNFLPAAK